jgi:hypothetical protein
VFLTWLLVPSKQSVLHTEGSVVMMSTAVTRLAKLHPGSTALFSN